MLDKLSVAFLIQLSIVCLKLSSLHVSELCNRRILHASRQTAMTLLS